MLVNHGMLIDIHVKVSLAPLNDDMQSTTTLIERFNNDVSQVGHIIHSFTKENKKGF